MKEHLIQAAERGNAEAQFNLSIMHENELMDSQYTVGGSRPEAVRWLLAAAEQGLPRAQIKLAETYADEPDKAGNPVKACAWFLLAMANLRGAHLQKAQSAYERASLRLTAAQITKARRFAQAWKPTGSVPAAISEPQATSDAGCA